MEKNFLINTIYRATEGEGVQIGTPQVFVRYQGCAVGCLNCDTKETWLFSGKTYSLEEVIEKIEKARTSGAEKIKRVSITGGDPLHPKHTDSVLELVKALKEKNIYVNIEAAGTRIVDPIFEIVDFISYDYKTPSTGVRVNKLLFKKLLNLYADKAQIKAVIFDKVDFDSYLELYKMYEDHENAKKVPWVITPCYEPGEKFPLKRFLDAIKWNEDAGGPFRVIGQQHKWLHGPNRRDV